MSVFVVLLGLVATPSLCRAGGVLEHIGEHVGAGEGASHLRVLEAGVHARPAPSVFRAHARIMSACEGQW